MLILVLSLNYQIKCSEFGLDKGEDLFFDSVKPWYRTFLFFVGVQCISAVTDLRADEVPQWRLEHLWTYEGNRKQDLGFLLFTVSTERNGVSFKCKNRNITGYLTERPIDIMKAQSSYHWRGTRRPVQYSINHGAEKAGDWYRSKDLASYMLNREANFELLNTVLVGSEIKFSLDGDDVITVVLPPVEPAIFDQFRDKCR